jgi:hypothetical protein
METPMVLVQAAADWMEGFSQSLDHWEAWLLQVERAYLDGQFERLAELEEEGRAIQAELADRHRDRIELLERASDLGHRCTDITSMLRRLEPKVSLGIKSRLRSLTQQLRRARQLSVALWVTGFQAAGYTAALLEILATGNPDRATYGTSERETLEGGRIMDAAA